MRPNGHTGWVWEGFREERAFEVRLEGQRSRKDILDHGVMEE